MRLHNQNTNHPFRALSEPLELRLSVVDQTKHKELYLVSRQAADVLQLKTGDFQGEEQIQQAG